MGNPENGGGSGKQPVAKRTNKRYNDFSETTHKTSADKQSVAGKNRNETLQRSHFKFVLWKYIFLITIDPKLFEMIESLLHYHRK